MSARVFVAAFFSGLAAFLLGWPVFGILLKDFYHDNTTLYTGLMRENPVTWAIFASNVAYGFLLSFIFYRWAKIWSWTEGFIAGFIISFLTGLSFDLFLYSTMNLYSPALARVDVILNAFFGGIQGAVAGIIIGWDKDREIK